MKPPGDFGWKKYLGDVIWEHLSRLRDDGFAEAEGRTEHPNNP